MSYTVTGQLTPQVGIQHAVTSGFLNGQTLAVPITLACTLTNGTTADKSDLIGVATFSFSGTTPQTVNLKTMLDVQGGAVAFVKVKWFILRLEATTDAVTVAMTPSASNGWTTGFLAASSTLTFQGASSTNPYGGFFIVSAPNTTGYAVDNTHKSIDLTPSATCTATLVVVGTSA